MASTGSQRGPAWDQDEIDATVDAYFELFANEIAGKSTVKVDVYRSLEQRFNKRRSWKAFERKMQNISAVLEENRLPRVRGLAPLKNVQGELRSTVERRLSQIGWLPNDAWEPRKRTPPTNLFREESPEFIAHIHDADEP
jgi:hypothetical protein